MGCRPKWIPQMAQTEAVYRQITRNPACRYSVLVPNEQGMADALAAGVRDISVFTAASETFSRKNTNASLDETFRRFKSVMAMARENGIRVRGYLSCAIACPYEGDIAPGVVAPVAKRLFDLGCAEISLGDTIGQGTPESISAMVAALALGIRTVDAAIHGLGGCPSMRGAKPRAT
jgi:hydroxymethylglutaryl-CoA lyase